MAETAGKEVTLPSNTEEDKDHSIGAKLAAQEQRQKLLNQIAMLRTYVSVLENRLETPKFGQLQLPKPLRNIEIATRCNVLDVRTKFRGDLYRFAGIRCVKCMDSFVFEISNTYDVQSSDLYAVEILIDNHGRGKLGRWILPMSVDVQKILSRHPIDDLKNMKQFLKDCKHHVDCYICRAKQLEELRNFFAGIKNVRVSHTIGIVQIELVMLGVKDIENDALRNVILYLSYNSAEVRPYKVLTDTDDNERPSGELLKKLNKHFKPFLKNDLSSAFQRVNEPQIEFLWKPIATEENESNLSGESLEDTGFLSAYLQRGKQKQKKSKNKEQDERSTSQDNETETSLCVEDEQCEDSNDVKEDKRRDDFSPADAIKTKSRKHKQSAKTRTAVLAVKKSLDDLREVESEVANVRTRNDADKRSNSKATSAVSRIQRYKQSRKCQTDTENTQIENNVLPKDENTHDNKKKPPGEADGNRRMTRKRKLFTESNDNESLKAITSVDERDRENYTTSNPNEQKKVRMNVSSSTPLTKKLPDKRKFFHASHISEIL